MYPSTGPDAGAARGQGDPLGQAFADVVETGLWLVGNVTGANIQPDPGFPRATCAQEQAAAQLADECTQHGFWASLESAWDSLNSLATGTVSNLVNPSYYRAPTAQAAAAGTKPASEETGQGGVVMVAHMRIGYHDPHAPGGVRAIDMRKAARHLEDRGLTVHAFKAAPNDGPQEWSFPFPRNMATEAPGQMLTAEVQQESFAASRLRMRTHLEQFFQQNDIRYKRLPAVVNFANIDYVPNAGGPGDDLLIGASELTYPMDAQTMAQLEREFQFPEHVVHLELDPTQLNADGGRLCYDLDLALHLTKNAQGRPVALVYWPCILENPTLGKHTRKDVQALFAKLGIEVVELSKADQANLAANCIKGARDGELLMSSSNVSKKLKARLKAAGVAPILPPAGTEEIGTSRTASPFGLHCITLHLRKPEAASVPEQQRKTDL